MNMFANVSELTVHLNKIIVIKRAFINKQVYLFKCILVYLKHTPAIIILLFN